MATAKDKKLIRMAESQDTVHIQTNLVDANNVHYVGLTKHCTNLLVKHGVKWDQMFEIVKEAFSLKDWSLLEKTATELLEDIVPVELSHWVTPNSGEVEKGWISYHENECEAYRLRAKGRLETKDWHGKIRDVTFGFGTLLTYGAYKGYNINRPAKLCQSCYIGRTIHML